MKPRDLSVKRKPVKRGLLYALHAKLGKIKRPAATATADPAELDGDIPRMNVGRALIVIALVHAVCIAGIFFQKYFENGGGEQGPQEPGSSPKSVAGAAALQSDQPDATASSMTRAANLPQLRQGDQRHMVIAGETYASIARKWNISDQALRAANNDINIFTGLNLRVPPREIVALEPDEMQRLRNGGKAPAILVRPNINVENAPRGIPILDEDVPAGNTYTVRKGDTFSKIARTYGTTASALMKHNGITNDRSLRIGQKLNIPSKQH